MSRDGSERALADALDQAQERLVDSVCGPRWGPVRGLPAPFSCPVCGTSRDFARKGKRTQPWVLETAVGKVDVTLWHVGCRVCGRNLAPLQLMLGLSGDRRSDQLAYDLAGLESSLAAGAPDPETE